MIQETKGILNQTIWCLGNPNSIFNQTNRSLKESILLKIESIYLPKEPV